MYTWTNPIDYMISSAPSLEEAIAKAQEQIDAADDEEGQVVIFFSERMHTVTRTEKRQAEKLRSCNRHQDCTAAENDWAVRNPDKQKHDIPASFHCYDNCCEECFGN